jgi:hypothetical protein
VRRHAGSCSTTLRFGVVAITQIVRRLETASPLTRNPAWFGDDPYSDDVTGLPMNDRELPGG